MQIAQIDQIPDQFFFIRTGGIVLIGLASLAFWLWMLDDCIKNESGQGNTKVVWGIVIVLLGILGALAYLFAHRPQRLRELGH